MLRQRLVSSLLLLLAATSFAHGRDNLRGLATTTSNRCGTNWSDAVARCGAPCPQGVDSECPSGQHCYAAVTCDGGGTTATTTAAPQVATTAYTGSATVTTLPISLPSTCGSSAMSVDLGYYQSWAIYRDSNCNGPYRPQHINANLYSHLVYAFARVGPSYTIELWINPGDEWQLNTEETMIAQLQALKQTNPKLKTLIAIGGWTHNDPGTATQTRFSTMAASATYRQAFAQSCVDFMRKYKFDGLDIDWEYPGMPDRGGSPVDKANLVELTKKLRTLFDQQPEKFLLTFAMPMGAATLDAGYDLANLHPYVSWFNLMAYDMHGSWEWGNANPHTPIPEFVTPLEKYFAAGVPSTKLVLGLASYGRGWTLSSTAACAGNNCAASGGCQAGTCSQTSGYLHYFEIEKLAAATQYDTTASTAYKQWNGNQWIGFDDPSTWRKKAEYAAARCLGGMMLWAVDTLPMNANIDVFTPPTAGGTTVTTTAPTVVTTQTSSSTATTTTKATQASTTTATTTATTTQAATKATTVSSTTAKTVTTTTATLSYTTTATTQTTTETTTTTEATKATTPPVPVSTTTTSSSSGPANRCGAGWSDAASKCGALCPSGLSSECPQGESCWAAITCTGVSSDTSTGSTSGTTATTTSSASVTTPANRCGTNWSTAASLCGALCPSGQNSECPSGQYCYAFITCS